MRSTPHDEVTERDPKTEIRWIRGRAGGVYQIVRDLPTGGMAEAFVALRRGLGDFAFPCCVKRMRGTDREEFLQEAHILGKLAHDRIVRAFEVDEDQDGVCFIAMELVDGVNLGQLLTYYQRRCRRMPPGLAIFVANEVLEALEYAYHRVVDGEPLHTVHRDVTPSNILLGRDGYVKLADFGIAKFKTRPSFTRTGRAKGKGPYMSPEHYEKRRGLDHRSDLFSLGATLYEMLTGEVAFGGDSEEETLYAVLHGKFEPLLELAPQVDPGLAALVQQLLEPDKDKRPRDAEEVRARLRAFEQHPSARAALARDVEACLAFDEQAKGAGAQRQAPGRVPGVLPPPGAGAPGPAGRSGAAGLPVIAERDQAGVEKPVQPAPQAVAPLEDVLSAPVAGGAGPKQGAAVPARARRTAVMGGGVALVLAAVVALVLGPLAKGAPQPTAKTRVPVAVASEPVLTLEASTPSLPANPAAPAVGSATVPSTPAGPLAAAPASPVVENARASAAPLSRPRARAQKPKTGALRIKVRAPRGFAWVDGRCHGRAPVLVESLAVGRHLVGASTDEKTAPTSTKEVEVVAGREVLVEVLLFDPFN